MRGGGLTVNYANVQIAQFESPEAAKSAWDPAVRPIADCTSWTDDQGTNWTVAEMSAPKLGDDSMGVRMQQKSGTAIVYLSRTGPAIVMVTGAGLTDVPTAELEMLLKAQVTSYQASLAKQQ
ncbi:hypothetical protein SAMN05421595_2196 [Austwickia chelonae]|nr:hypothetical protein SAMN05421595_2196 [Austwickia chelonae]